MTIEQEPPSFGLVGIKSLWFSPADLTDSLSRSYIELFLIERKKEREL